MARSYYAASAADFLLTPNDQILGELVRHHQFALEDLQRNAWVSQIELLKTMLPGLPESHISWAKHTCHCLQNSFQD